MITDNVDALNWYWVGRKMATKMPHRRSSFTNVCVILQVHTLEFSSTFDPSYMFNVVTKSWDTVVCLNRSVLPPGEMLSQHLFLLEYSQLLQ